MSEKILSFFLIGLLFNLTCYQTALANPEKEARFAAKVKAEIGKLGFGKDARIKVKLRDKTKLKGYVSEISDNHFVVVNEKSGIAFPVAYSKVKQVKGNNLSTGTIVGVAIFLTIVITLAVLTVAKEDDH